MVYACVFIFSYSLLATMILYTSKFFEGSQILQILLIGHSYEQGFITNKEYMIVQNNFKFALDAYTASYPSTLIIHSLADNWSFIMNQHTRVAKL